MPQLKKKGEKKKKDQLYVMLLKVYVITNYYPE